jgi:hypothetical protein
LGWHGFDEITRFTQDLPPLTKVEAPPGAGDSVGTE